MTCMEQIKTPDPLLVEAFLSGGAVINGLCRQVEERKRLVDVLNSTEGTIEIEMARLFLRAGTEPMVFPTISIEKRSIVAAVPRETSAQNRRRAVLTNMMGGRRQRMHKDVTVICPPYAIEGVAHVAEGSGTLRPSPDIFTHFFPMTDVVITLAGEGERILPVVLVNRDAIVGMTLHSRRAAAA
jgi:hypothetical protein